MAQSKPLFLLFFIWGYFTSTGNSYTESETPTSDYSRQVQLDRPVVVWGFDDALDVTIANVYEFPDGTRGSKIAGKREGAVDIKQNGPRPEVFPLFAKDNLAIGLQGKRGFIRVADPVERSPFDFTLGDSITIEAWVVAELLNDDQQVYIIGKGRTNNSGFSRENQNWALRLRGVQGEACLSFLFRDQDTTTGDSGFHRWTTVDGIALDSQWHHVAVSYVFGEPNSIHGYIDGQQVAGAWDMGGATQAGPVVDNDEVWIGSALGGDASNTFHGLVDEIALYRHVVAADRLASHYRIQVSDPVQSEFNAASKLPIETVVVELHEGIPKRHSWAFSLSSPTLTYEQQTLSFAELPKKYSVPGVIADWSNPLLHRSRLRHIVAPEQAGPHDLLLRTKGPARLFIDGRLVAQTKFLNPNASGHEAVPELTAPAHRDLCSLAAGHQEQFVRVTLEPGEHVFRLDAIVGGPDLRPELGEVCIGLRRGEEPFQILSGGNIDTVMLTEPGWLEQLSHLQRRISALNTSNRRAASSSADGYWQRRHEYARQVMKAMPSQARPPASGESLGGTAVDSFVAAKLLEKNLQPTELIDDLEFLRRVSIDLIGVIPTGQEIGKFLNDEPTQRRSQVIERLLDDPRWADNWVGYWQDVLAENPGILKPELNNTGPFRVWIHESLIDNKPFDRLVTELISMEGSRYYGGPAGFGLATQNDVPFAEKANILAQAFLGQNMKCARCHDAPYHPHKQAELFHIAAMLNRKPITVPPTSSVPQQPGGRKPLVEITLQPGQSVEPSWPFNVSNTSEFPADLIPNPDDSRDKLAVLITAPQNDQFARVIVNRLWKRYLGRGIVEPVDDWHGVQPSLPDLLDYLARELVSHEYDLKHVTRLIVNAQAYQRRLPTATDPDASMKIQWFAAASARRMSAEQIIDSLFTIAGKSFDAEPLTMDPEGRRPVETFLNLGMPDRAWQFTSLSNERDRPALALPKAQSLVDVLIAFGWRDARPNPVSVRDDQATMIQPLTLANGIASNRIVRLSDDNALTAVCLQERPLVDLIDELFQRILSRAPNPMEVNLFCELLQEGFESRRIDLANHPAAPAPKRRQDAVSWSNHLSAEATRIRNEQERALRAGDPPTQRLQNVWRERAEDCIWSLLNSPEFIFLP